MFRAPSIGGLILAAGDSSRMGTDKALLPWPPSGSVSVPSRETFLSAAIRSLSHIADFVLVVVGKNEAALRSIVYSAGESVVVNRDPSRGQFSSLQVGVQEILNRGRDAALITLVDRPPASIETLDALHDAFEFAPNEIWAVIPEYEGKHGHPFLAGRELMAAFLQAPVTSNAREVEHRFQQHIQYVPVNDPKIVMNINTPEEYAQLASHSH